MSWLAVMRYNPSLSFFTFFDFIRSKWIHPNKMPTVLFFLLHLQLFSFEWCHHSDTSVVRGTFDSLSSSLCQFFLVVLCVTHSWRRRLRSELDGISDCAPSASSSFWWWLLSVCVCVCESRSRKKKEKNKKSSWLMSRDSHQSSPVSITWCPQLPG
jgi:hypothetical protein